jgi:hypothetical protein
VTATVSSAAPVRSARVNATGLLYGAVGGPNATSDLYTINPANGAATSVGPIGYAVTGMVFANGTLFGVTTSHSAASPRSLIRIDPATGAGTLVGSYGSCCQNIADIAFNPAKGKIFGWGEGPDDLVKIHKATGEADVAGDSGKSTFGDAMSFNSAGKLFAAIDGTCNPIYKVKTSTGEVSPGATLGAGPFGCGHTLNAGAFACDGSTFYASAGSFGSSADLVTVDVHSGAITTMGPSVNHLDALAWDC